MRLACVDNRIHCALGLGFERGFFFQILSFAFTFGLHVVVFQTEFDFLCCRPQRCAPRRAFFFTASIESIVRFVFV